MSSDPNLTITIDDGEVTQEVEVETEDWGDAFEQGAEVVSTALEDSDDDYDIDVRRS